MSSPEFKVALPRLASALKDGSNLTQRGLAAFLGIHESNISRLIRGKAQMLTRERIRLIEEYTGKTFEYLADLKEANLSEDEVAMMEARRNAPPEIRAAIDTMLAPYKP